MQQKGAQIDYDKYSTFMRKALSSPEMYNDDGSLNHIYFNTKKGFYWSEENNQHLKQGIIKYGTDWALISKEVFQNTKVEVEIELRACIILGVKQAKNIGEKQISKLKKELEKPKGKIGNKKK